MAIHCIFIIFNHFLLFHYVSIYQYIYLYLSSYHIISCHVWFDSSFSFSLSIVLNFGVHGRRMMKYPDDMSYWETSHLQVALQSHPHIVILQFGSNDCVRHVWDEDAFRRDYKEMIRKFQSLESKPRVYMCIPPPLYESNAPCEDPVYDLRCEFKHMINYVLPSVLRGIAIESNVTLINNFDALGGEMLTRPDTIIMDHLHPNDLGYLAMAHEVAYELSVHENFSQIAFKAPYFAKQ